MNKARIISEFLVTLARHVEQLTDEDIEDLLDNSYASSFFHRQSKSPLTKSLDRAEVQSKAEALMRELQNQSSREDAIAFLVALAPSRRVLIEAAKMRELHIVRGDTVGTISEKLVQNVVGSRLDSARIRGT